MDSLPSEPRGKPQNTGVCMPMPSPGDLPDPGIEPRSPALQENSLPSEPPGKPGGYTGTLIPSKEPQNCSPSEQESKR